MWQLNHWDRLPDSLLMHCIPCALLDHGPYYTKAVSASGNWYLSVSGTIACTGWVIHSCDSLYVTRISSLAYLCLSVALDVLGNLGEFLVGCIYTPYKVNPNIFQFYSDLLDIFHHISMHPLFRNIYEFYFIFSGFISSSIIYNNYLYSRQHFLFWFCLVPDLLILSHTSCLWRQHYDEATTRDDPRE